MGATTCSGGSDGEPQDVVGGAMEPEDYLRSGVAGYIVDQGNTERYFRVFIG